MATPARAAILALTAAMLTTLAACQTQQSYDERYGPVENWPSYQAVQNLGRGD